MSTDIPEVSGNHWTDWLTLAAAAQQLEVSVKTVRRRVKAGELVGEMVHDPVTGVDRWMIDPTSFPQATQITPMIPIEVPDRTEDADGKANEATVRAKRVAEFEKQGRHEAEVERDATMIEVAEIRAKYEGVKDKKWWQRSR